MDNFNMDEDILVTSSRNVVESKPVSNGINNLCVNEQAIKRQAQQNKKLSINKLKKILKVVGGIAFAGLIFVSGYNIHSNIVDNQIPQKMDNCIMTEAKVYVYEGATISDLAAKYYNGNDQELYEQYYGDFDKYKKAALEANNRSEVFDEIKEGTYVDIPIIFDINNPFYKECVVLQQQIKEIEANNYWVSYTVKLGDSCSKLAAMASASEAETKNLESKIMQHNGLKTSNDLLIGTSVEIVNPELGKLKLQLEETKNNLYSYLQSTNQNEIGKQM